MPGDQFDVPEVPASTRSDDLEISSDSGIGADPSADPAAAGSGQSPLESGSPASQTGLLDYASPDRA